MEKHGRKNVLLRYYTWNEHSAALVEYLLFFNLTKEYVSYFVYIYVPNVITFT